MPIQAATFRTTEERLRDMIAATQAWRAIVASPTSTFEDLAPLIDAGGIVEGQAKSRIVYGWFDETVEYGPPRCVLRQVEPDETERSSSTGKTFDLSMRATFELPPAASHVVGADITGAGYLDARRKISFVFAQVLELPRQYPWADLVRGRLDSFGQPHPDENQNEAFATGSFTVLCRGTL